MPITSWPKEDRPREKLLEKGETQLTDAELIAIFIRAGTRGKTALDIAKTLLMQYGGLRKLLAASPHELIQQPGIGYARYATLKAALELGRRYLANQLAIGSIISSAEFMKTVLAQRMQEYQSEVFACLFLDTHLRLISFEELFYGTINEANVYPREIIRRCIHHNAAKVILVHNHPSGQSKPSTADQTLTATIQHALLLMNVELIDHIIIGCNHYYSFANKGYI